ncbi:alpha/beta fold hydrolase [Glaciihabitans arcticus]|uniref:alpha/beta fold hydrolase n=1 Tax=Glaciihabitans arcticus TaxID=2668039 RepID=UPI00138702B9|nr:alpha/beta fold hydrolase [Glaciihabitans arcticus]
MRTLPISSSDGASTVVEVYGNSGPSVLFLPGLGVPISYFAPFLTEWADRGFTIYALELRGMPLSSTTDIRSNEFGYAHALEFDIPAAIAQTDIAVPFILAGHSLGGQLALLYTGRGTSEVAAVISIASGSSHASALKSSRLRIRRRAQVGTIGIIARTLGYHPGDRLGFGGRQPRRMIEDWAHEARTGRFRLAGSTFDDEGGIATITQPVLMLTLEGDRLISPEASGLLAARAVAAEVTKLHLTDERPFDHFRWARKQPAQVAGAVTIWLGQQQI